MSFAYDFFVGTVQTLGIKDVFSCMIRREEVADLVMEIYKLSSNKNGLPDRMTYRPMDIVDLLHFQVASFLFCKQDELRKLRELKRRSSYEYRVGVANLAMVAYAEAMDIGRNLNASGSTVRQFLNQLPA